MSLEQLRRIEPTATLTVRLAGYRVALDSIPKDQTPVRAKAAAMIAQLEVRIELAEKRDEIAAARPEGCWCLGIGGEEMRYIPDLDGGGIPVFSRCCSCPEGLAEKARKEIETEHYMANKRAIRERQYFRDAQVPAMFEHCSFETYPVSQTTEQAVAAVKKWASDGGDGYAESLLLYGSFGTGKTGLAVSATRMATTERGMPALFLPTPSLLDRIRATYEKKSDESEGDLIEAVKNTDLLVLDDLGAERPTEWVREKLFTIINHRHDECMATIFTSNLAPKELAEHLGERTAWRIIEMSQVIKLDGPNLRDRKKAKA